MSAEQTQIVKPNIYIPPQAVTLEYDMPQIRLGLQGEPGSGKTTSALTFPNPIVLNCDRGLTGFGGRKDIYELKVWDNEWLKVTPVNGKKFDFTSVNAIAPNRRDWILHWMRYEALKLTSEQTLIIDSWTRLQDFFDFEQELVNTDNPYDFWAKKIDFSDKMMEYICSVKCHVVVCFHEMKERDKTTGQLMGKAKPLMQGNYVGKIKMFFSDFFRMYDKPIMKNNQEVGTEYFWQVKSSSNFDAKTRLDLKSLGENIYTRPHFDIFKEFKRKQQ